MFGDYLVGRVVMLGRLSWITSAFAVLVRVAKAAFVVLAVVTTIGLSGAIILGAYWLFYPLEPLTRFHDKVPIMNPERTLGAGDTLIYHAKSVHHTTGVRVERSMELRPRSGVGFLYSFPKTGYITEAGHFEGFNSTIVIPEETPPGEYIIRFVITFHINILRDIDLVLETEPFTVE